MKWLTGLLAGMALTLGVRATVHADWCSQSQRVWRTSVTLTADSYAVLSTTPIIVFDIKTASVGASGTSVYFFDARNLYQTTSTKAYATTTSPNPVGPWCIGFSSGLIYNKTGTGLLELLWTYPNNTW